MAYTGSSITDYLKSVGKPSNFASRAKLAEQHKISGYGGTAAQNTQLLNLLRGGETKSKPLSSAPGYVGPKGSQYGTKKAASTSVTKDFPTSQEEFKEWQKTKTYNKTTGKWELKTAPISDFTDIGSSTVQYKSPTGYTYNFNPNWNEQQKAAGLANLKMGVQHGALTQEDYNKIEQEFKTPTLKSIGARVQKVAEKTKALTTQVKTEGIDPQDNQNQINDIDDKENQQQENELEIINNETSQVDVSDSSKLITSLLEKLDEEPETKSAQEIFNEQREELGIGGLEDDLASIDSEIESLEADFASTMEGEEGRKVSMGQIRKRQGAQEIKYNRMKRDLQVERNSIVNQLNMKYGVLNSMVKFAGMDYDNAQQDYQFKFNAALQLTNILATMENREKTDEERKIDNARANLQIMYNLIKSGNISYDSLDQTTLLEIKNMELQSGLPTGFVKFIDEKIKDPMVSFLPGFTDENGNRVQPVATVSPDGKYSISNIKVGKAEVKGDKDIISQAKINQLAAAGVPQAVAEDIQRSLNAGVAKPTIIAHLDKQLGKGKGQEMMDSYDSIMSDIMYQF